MSTQFRNLNPLLEDKEFVKNYFRGVRDGNDVTQRLVKDGATINSPDLIARLVGWLEEAEPSEDSESDAKSRAEQEVASLGLPSQQKEEDEEASASGVITGDKTGTSSGSDSAKTGGGQSSDGATRTSFPLGSSGKSSDSK
jgi:hypothetical protein